MRLSVIVPAYDASDTLPRCLAAFSSSLRVPDEVIVVNDGSKDDSPSLARARGVMVVATERGPRGPACARNRGAALATGDVLVFVDADVALHPDALARMADVFEAQPCVQALFGSYDDRPSEPGTASRFKNLLHHYVHQHGKREASTFWAGCGAIRRDAFFAVGGFDESYRRPSIEDIELGGRLARAGMPIRLCPEIQATHMKRWTLASLWRTDLFARAVPWTRLVLREGHMPDDLNLNRRSRASAVCVWAAAWLLVLSPWLAWGALGGAAACLTASTWLNADLHCFLFRCGGLRFAVGSWFLYHAYLLYGSAVFGALVLAHTCRSAASARPTRSGAGDS